VNRSVHAAEARPLPFTAAESGLCARSEHA
jgi:hypothetical protein